MMTTTWTPLTPQRSHPPRDDSAARGGIRRAEVIATPTHSLYVSAAAGRSRRRSLRTMTAAVATMHNERGGAATTSVRRIPSRAELSSRGRRERHGVNGAHVVVIIH